jgi:hypothetical protein
MNPFDLYVNKTVPLKYRGQDMSFELSHALFSSFDIDQGTRLLLKAVAANVDPAAVGSILDIGSGTGVLGVACARGYPGSTVRMRDRDALACAFSERNARRNKVTPVAVDHALFLDGLAGEKFDLVLCNVPAKAGTPVLDAFLRDLPRIVSGRGYGAIVVVEPIAAASLASLREAEAETLAVETRPGHTAVVFRRGRVPDMEKPLAVPGGSEPDPLAVFVRSEQSLRAGKTLYTLKGYWGLPEFDTPSFESELAMDLLEAAMSGSLLRRAAFVNPGVGRVACHAKARVQGLIVDACGRDALALAASAANLALNVKMQDGTGMSCAFWEDLPSASYDLLVEVPDVVPKVDTIDPSWSNAVRILKRGGSYMASMPSSSMDRFEKRRPKGFVRISGRKKKGYACTAWRLE